MSLLEITGLSHTFGDNILYKDANFTLNKGEHVGIVGQNGTGKSTFIKICTDQVIPDAGRVIWQRGTTLGYLDQYAEIQNNTTIREFLKSAFDKLYEIEKKMHKLYDEADGNMNMLRRAANCQEKLEAGEFYLINTKIEQISSGLGLLAIGLDRKINELSGGQRAKVILAKLLLESPDVLLLDEPTNFLDVQHIEWFTIYLSSLKKAFMIISHDYDFLNKVTDRICDIDNEKINKYYGTYTQFLDKKEMLREDYIKKYTQQQKEIKKTEIYIQKNLCRESTHKMAKSRQKKLERMDKLEELTVKENKPNFIFNSVSSVISTQQLSVKNLKIGYYYPIISGINFEIKGGEKVVITGFNGIGKSTLLKTLIKQIPALDGSFEFSQQVTLAYFEQDLIWEDTEKTPIDIISGAYPRLSTKDVRKHLARCGVLTKQAMQGVGTLSGGEQAKVKMCLLVLAPCNFIIMDEPTNHLDIYAKQALKKALGSYKGTVLLVSHEKEFYKDFADKVINIENLLMK